MADDDDGERTEEPTGRRISEAEERGQFAKSQDTGTFFSLAGALLLLWALPGYLGEGLLSMTWPLLETPEQITIGDSGTTWLAQELLLDFLLLVLPASLVMLVTGIAGVLVQHRPILSLKPLEPQLSRISPLAGLKRLFSLRSLVEFIKTILKLSAALGAVYIATAPDWESLPGMTGLDAAMVLSVLHRESLQILGAILALLFVLGAFDMLYQRWQHLQSLRMTRQEVRDEFRQSEGDPLIKARMRSLRMERMRRRMMAAVPKADVVITNPVHYAVALRYDPDSMQAPALVAKGADAVALRIQEIARKHRIPVVVEPPLARVLFRCDIGQEIPPAHYRAVAGIISHVYRMTGRQPAS